MWQRVLFGLVLTNACRGAELIVALPLGETVHVANAIERGSQVVQPGRPVRTFNQATSQASGGTPATAQFAGLQAGSTYDLAIETGAGQLLCGVDLSWCDSTPTDPQAETLGEDDQAAIAAIVKDIKGFANKPSIIRLVGDHDRAVALINLVRDNGFHSNTGDEVIWRAEVWFFRWENGGWERVANQSRVLRRERFASHADYNAEVDRICWLPALGGVKVVSEIPLTIELKKSDLAPRAMSLHAAKPAAISPPTTKASSSAAESHPTTLFAP